MSDRETATDEPAGTPIPDAGSRREERTAPLVCWICQQPVDPVEADRWRSEPVHPDCVGDEREFVDG